MPYAPAPRPRRGRTALIVGLALLVAVVFTSGLGAAVYTAAYYAQHGAVPFVATPMPTATPNSVISLQDPLTTNVYGWAVLKPYCQFANGGYQISDRICFAPIEFVYNGSISVQARQIAGALDYGYGFVLRWSSEGNYYAFDIAGGGYSGNWIFYKVVYGKLSPIVNWKPTDIIHGGLNETNTLLVQFNGSHFDFFINGVKVGQANDSTFSVGPTGLESGTNMQVVFNNITITRYA